MANPDDAEPNDSGPDAVDERLLRPTFGSLLNPQGYGEDDEDDEDDDFSLPADWRLSDPTAETDGDFADDKADVFDEDFDPETAEDEDGPELGLARLIESEFERAERGDRKPIDLAALDLADDAIEPEEPGSDTPNPGTDEFTSEAFAQLPDHSAPPAADFGDPTLAEEYIGEAAFDSLEPDNGENSVADEALDVAGAVDAIADLDDHGNAEAGLEPQDGEAGLYDCLAEARELAQAAQHSENRSRTALYAAVGRAYDVSLAAQDAPDDFAELLEESGLAMQDRAPMTPIVKLVFGADYDKTRLTEYATALSHAHRIGIERGKLGSHLAGAEGGLKGIVREERRLRREEAGKTTGPRDAVRVSLAEKLRAIEGFALADLPAEGQEFGLIMIRRTTDGDIVVLGEVDEDIPLIERIGRKIAG